MVDIHTLPRLRAVLTIFILIATAPLSLALIFGAIITDSIKELAENLKKEKLKSYLGMSVASKFLFFAGVNSCIKFAFGYGLWLNAVFSALTIIAFHFADNKYPTTQNSKVSVLITGGKMTKSLLFARWFWKCGYRVVLVETPRYWICGTRFSRAVSCFYTVTPPKIDQEAYIKELERIVEKECINYFVPISAAADAVYDSIAKKKLEKLGCAVLHFDTEITEILDDKQKFFEYAGKMLSLNIPKSIKVESSTEVHKANESLKNESKVYVLKSLTYDPIHRLDLFKLPCSSESLQNYLATLENPISKERPWQVQQFVKGVEYAVFAVLRKGKIRALTISESSSSQLNYKHENIPQIEEWLDNFAKRTKLTGQISFDFIVDDLGVAYCIECNPRVHSQCSVFLKKDELGKAVLDENWEEVLKPEDSNEQIYWFYNEFFKLLPNSIFNYGNISFYNALATEISGKDAILDSSDPLPFLVTNHLQMPLLLITTAIKGRPWKKLDFCIGKVVEIDGD